MAGAGGCLCGLILLALALAASVGVLVSKLGRRMEIAIDSIPAERVVESGALAEVKEFMAFEAA